MIPCFNFRGGTRNTTDITSETITTDQSMIRMRIMMMKKTKKKKMMMMMMMMTMMMMMITVKQWNQ